MKIDSQKEVSDIMSALIDVSIETLKRMPENSSLEDIMYEINFVAQVLEGLKASEEGRTITTEELLKQVEEWSK